MNRHHVQLQASAMTALLGVVLTACSSGDTSPADSGGSAPVAIDTDMPVSEPTLILLGKLVGSSAPDPMSPAGDDPAPGEDGASLPSDVVTPPADATPTGGTSLPSFNALGDALLGVVPETEEAVDGMAVLPRVQNRFRNDEDYDLWGCNPIERETDLIVYSYIGAFGVLTQPDPVTLSPENARADTYAVTETTPGVLLLEFLGLGQSEEIRDFRFAADGERYDAFSSSWGPIACARISAPF